MDDVDAVQAQIARNMLTSGDWVIARLDGVPYIEKSPLIYWLIGASYRVFGVHDWAARIPVVLSAILLAWLTYRFGLWSFGAPAGTYAGLAVATSLGLYLFTRIQIPDVMLTFTVTLAFFSFLRALEPDERHPRLWTSLLAGSIGVGILLKGLIAIVLPCGGIFLYLALTRQLFSRASWQRLHVLTGAIIVAVVAVPWHLSATLRMPPYFDFSLHSGPGEYHGFFWFYFINEHVLRFLNLRYPRDYNTVPRPAFWLLHFVWLFPWSVYIPAAFRSNYKPVDRGGRVRLLSLCWVAFLMLFFTFSTTQEYYSMPIYPALALLIGSAILSDSPWVTIGTRALGVLAALAFLAIVCILISVGGLPTPGDISQALHQHSNSYTLSMGHMGDLTLESFAYLRTPLIVAGVALLLGACSALLLPTRRAILGVVLMMVLFLQASRMALVVFDPYLTSRPLAETLLGSPDGRLIFNGEYYSFSSAVFYTNRSALLLNGRGNNLEYGSYVPGSAEVFLNDAQFCTFWTATDRSYLLSDDAALPRLFSLVDFSKFYLVSKSGGKSLYTNLPLNQSSSNTAQSTLAEPR
jgi:hypothetical protein